VRSRALADGRVEVPAHAVVKGEAFGLTFQVSCKPICYSFSRLMAAGTDVRSVGERRRRKGDGVGEGAAGEKGGERVRQRIAGS
jgi:hypothetical protein